MTDRHKKKELSVLILEPYYGGSHKSFLAALSDLPFRFELMTFPARKWKWRMRLAGPVYAEKLRQSGKRYDRILCSTFVDVAAFRGLAPSWVNDVPLLTYFHENQFVYPMQIEDERDFHFALTNTTSALASDSLAFNSGYNLESFLSGTERLQKKSYDLRLDDPAGNIRLKSKVIFPPVDFSAIDTARSKIQKGPPVILWNHRWEHDKNPEFFFKTILDLKRKGLDFRLVLLGESFKEHPAVFEEAGRKLGDRILHSGFVKSRREYARWLNASDIIVSTSDHEFFGMAVIEAVRAGCIPLLPKRLSYPELFPERYLYRDRDFVRCLGKLIAEGKRLSETGAKKLTDRFSRDSLMPVYEEWIHAAKKT